jgi:hypothetical protein
LFRLASGHPFNYIFNKAMQTPLKRQFIATGVFALVLLGLMLTHHREPRFQDKTLTEWLRETQTYPGTASERDAQNKALIAVKEIGTNAVPQLLNWFTAKDTALDSKWNHLVRRHSLTRSWQIESAYERRSRAALGFQILGIDAQAATPALLSLTTNSDEGLAICSFEALLRVNAEVESYRKLLPPLLHSSNPYVRERSAHELILIPIPEKEKEHAFQLLAEVAKSGQSAISRQPFGLPCSCFWPDSFAQ